jgi:undecaprenyl-diphosphatase
MRIGHDEQLKHNHMLLWLLAIGTIPVGVAGLLFNKQAEGAWRNPFVIGTMLIAIGMLMWIAENAARQQRDMASVGGPDAVVHRTGAGAGCHSGRFAQRHHHQRGPVSQSRPPGRGSRFSFLLSTPVIGAAAAKTLWDMHKATLACLITTNFVVGVAVSALSGCAVIAWFLHYLRRSGSKPFAYYRIFWHNSACSGFHPPASVMKLLSPTRIKG